MTQAGGSYKQERIKTDSRMMIDRRNQTDRIIMTNRITQTDRSIMKDREYHDTWRVIMTSMRGSRRKEDHDRQEY